MLFQTAQFLAATAPQSETSLGLLLAGLSVTAPQGPMKQWRSSFLLRGLLLAGLAAAKVAGECDRPSDVVFVIDGSGSITDANFKLVRGLVTDIAQRFQINPPDGIQMGIVEFGSAGQLWLLQLNASTSTPYFVDQVQNKMPYLDGSTCALMWLERRLLHVYSSQLMRWPCRCLRRPRRCVCF